jgi:hypothetical protein
MQKCLELVSFFVRKKNRTPVISEKVRWKFSSPVSHDICDVGIYELVTICQDTLGTRRCFIVAACKFFSKICCEESLNKSEQTLSEHHIHFCFMLMLIYR